MQKVDNSIIFNVTVFNSHDTATLLLKKKLPKAKDYEDKCGLCCKHGDDSDLDPKDNVLNMSWTFFENLNAKKRH